MSRAKRRDPVTFVLSPTLTNSADGSIETGSSPERLVLRCISGSFRGFRLLTFSAIARMWSGVVPQHPPTIFKKPASTNSAVTLAMCSGVSS